MERPSTYLPVYRGLAALAAAAALAVIAVAPSPASAEVVNFRQNALFTCSGAMNGQATGNTADITPGLAGTVRAVVTVRATPGTTVFGQLTQGFCARLKFFTLTVPSTGVGRTTVSDIRVSATAFVWFNTSAGQLQITPQVTL